MTIQNSPPSYKPDHIEDMVVAKLLKIFDLFSALSVNSLHGSRKKFIIRFIISLIICKNVRSTELATWLNDEVQVSSNVRRIQRFYEKVKLSYVQIACLLLFLLPTKGKLVLCIDRTNWSYGKLDINVLALTAYCKGVGVPLWFNLLDNKGGNSNTEQRKRLISKLLRILPKHRIGCILADREFIGFEWWQFLVNNKLPYYIRIRKNAQLIYKGTKRAAADWGYAIRKRYLKNVELEDSTSDLKIVGQVAIKRLAYQPDEDTHLIILTNQDAKTALDIYRKRWSIEVFFQSIKGRGFQIEDTCLDSLTDIKKLFALVCLTFATCFYVGIWKDEHQKPIEIKNHGYKANSFFRYGLDALHKVFKNMPKHINNVLMFCDLILKTIFDNAKQWSHPNQHILINISFVT